MALDKWIVLFLYRPPPLTGNVTKMWFKLTMPIKSDYLVETKQFDSFHQMSRKMYTETAFSIQSKFFAMPAKSVIKIEAKKMFV